MFTKVDKHHSLPASGTTGLARGRANFEQVWSALATLHRPRACSRLKGFVYLRFPALLADSVTCLGSVKSTGTRDPSRQFFLRSFPFFPFGRCVALAFLWVPGGQSCFDPKSGRSHLQRSERAAEVPSPFYQTLPPASSWSFFSRRSLRA